MTGDDILGRLDELIGRGHTLADMETGRPLSEIRDRVLSANAYLGMAPMVEALRGGADVVVTGRVTDTGLTVRVSGIEGGPRTPMLKVSIAYFYGYKAVGTLVYAWPDAYDKAKAADRILRQRLADLGLEFEQILTEFVGVDATHGRLSGPPCPDLPEVQLRVGVRARDKAPVDRFTREIAPLVLTGPPSVTGFAGGRPAVEEVVAYWPALVDRREIEQHVKVEILSA